MSRVSRYLDELRRCGAERKRLTAQLQSVVATAMDAIATNADVGVQVDAPHKPGYILAVEVIEGSLVTWQTVTMRHANGTAFACGADRMVWSMLLNPYQVYSDTSPKTRIVNAGRDEWLWAANHLAEIVSAFVVRMDQVASEVLEAIQVVRRWSEQHYLLVGTGDAR